MLISKLILDVIFITLLLLDSIEIWCLPCGFEMWYRHFWHLSVICVTHCVDFFFQSISLNFIVSVIYVTDSPSVFIHCDPCYSSIYFSGHCRKFCRTILSFSKKEFL